MAKIEIIGVGNENLVSIVELLAYEIWREHYTPIVGEGQVEYMLGKFQSKIAISRQINQEGFLYYLIKDDKDNYIGYLGVLPKEEELFLSKIYIKSGQRGKGYGRQAIEFIEKLAHDKGLNKMTLTVNKKNTSTIETYKKIGFIILNPVVQDIGDGFVMDDYKMEKTL
ncbi:MAG: GNAT family N-acetyltransferase [Candidatus Omnitrophota bacterium]